MQCILLSLSSELNIFFFIRNLHALRHFFDISSFLYFELSGRCFSKIIEIMEIRRSFGGVLYILETKGDGLGFST